MSSATTWAIIGSVAFHTLILSISFLAPVPQKPGVAPQTTQNIETDFAHPAARSPGAAHDPPGESGAEDTQSEHQTAKSERVEPRPSDPPTSGTNETPDQPAPESSRPSETPAEKPVEQGPKGKAADPTPNGETRTAPEDASGSDGDEAAIRSGQGKDSGEQGSDVDRRALRAGYLQKLAPGFDREHYYPDAARRLGLSGRVLVSVVIDADGTIVEIGVRKPSEHDRLNKAAVDAVERIETVPAPPKPLLEDGTLEVVVPMVYSLN